MSIVDELLALFEIDSQLLSLKKRLEAGPKEIKEQEEAIAAARETRREAEEAVKGMASEADQCNLDIRTAEAEIAEQEEKLKGIKNNKEYKIVTGRIKDLKQEINDKETRAIELMESLDKLRENVKEKIDTVQQAEERIAGLRKEIEKEAAEIRQEAKGIKEKRQTQIKRIEEMDVNALAAYKMGFRRGAGVAMAEMADGTCQACFRRASPNIENTVLVGRDIKNCVCAGCGRILYARKAVNS